jgi:hypothetical protein
MKKLIYVISLLLIITSCTKEEQDYDTIQIAIVAKDTIVVKYYNGIDTIRITTRCHFSTSFNLPNNNLQIPKVYVKGTIITYRLYINGNISNVYNNLSSITYPIRGKLHNFGVVEDITLDMNNYIKQAR